MVLKNGVKNIQTMAYNGARTVIQSQYLPRNSQNLGLSLFKVGVKWTVTMQMKAINIANVKCSISFVYSIPSFVGRKLGMIV